MLVVLWIIWRLSIVIEDLRPDGGLVLESSDLVSHVCCPARRLGVLCQMRVHILRQRSADQSRTSSVLPAVHCWALIYSGTDGVNQQADGPCTSSRIMAVQPSILRPEAAT